jgi:hypothetical protein
MSGAILPLPQYAIMAWCLVKARGELYLYLTIFIGEGHVVRMEEMRNAYRILFGKPEGKKPLARPRRRRGNIIRTGVRMRRCD